MGDEFRFSECKSQQKNYTSNCNWCYAAANDGVYLRRCFMTGEYCSKQTNIQRQRKKQYDEKETTISAFVIMNFSDMSDVVYKWKLKPFIESLTKYLFLNRANKRIYCSKTENTQVSGEFTKIEKINVIRSDSDPSSNYVICSRICQQMQIADIIIVDVSSQNANVFYEFGMAVALGKLVLPICYSESFYKMDDELFNRCKTNKPHRSDGSIIPANAEDPQNESLQHIGCYPWRKRLYEYYGIKYRNNDSHTVYADYEYVTQECFGFTDIKYRRFPYAEKIHNCNKNNYKNNYKNDDIIGKRIYDKLHDGYNDAKTENNTLVVYTIEGFLNEKQAGTCIVNFYRDITARMDIEQCFCGERVGVLVQEKVIPQDEKDAEKQLDLYYNVGEIIHIGVNQATYLAEDKKIKISEELINTNVKAEKSQDPISTEEAQKNEIEHFVKAHVRNRGMLIYPNNPVYVNRLKSQTQVDILDDLREVPGACHCCNPKAFTLYHVMLRNLRYTNEIVVDISDNCLQSLFWLGAAHGSDINAITVLHDKTDKEREANNGIGGKKNRNVFDVAGLWTAIFKTNDTDGFYRQLAQAQLGIENHSRLIVARDEYYEENIRDLFLSHKADSNNPVWKELIEKIRKDEDIQLESYYRKEFRHSMVRYNRLIIYLAQQNDKTDDDSEPRIRIAKWDFDAVSALTHYLSKRTVIGEYVVKSLQIAGQNKNGIGTTNKNSFQNPSIDINAEGMNFICVGAFASPLGTDLPIYISEKLGTKRGGDINMIHKRAEPVIKDMSGQCVECQNCHNGPCTQKRVYKGFQCIESSNTNTKKRRERSLFTQHSQSECTEDKKCTLCSAAGSAVKQDERFKIYDQSEIDSNNLPACDVKSGCIHAEIAQLILWREKPVSQHGRTYFRVGMYGSSGPATYALSALFVDEDQKKEYWPGQSDDFQPPHLLLQLQGKVRKKFMDEFLKELVQRLGKTPKTGRENRETTTKDSYIDIAIYASSYYLSTVLYRYFFPFISDKDIDCIYNGMYLFMHSMNTAKCNPFTVDTSQETEVIKTILDVLLNLLKGFTGYEVFYEVKVNQEKKSCANSNRDTRSVQGIEMMDEINYFICSRSD